MALAGCLAGLSWGQTPSYLHVPAAKGRLQQALWCIDQAKALGYEGVVLPVGTNSIQDPDRTDWSAFESAVREAARLGLRLHLRLMQDVPVSTFSGGVRTGDSAWVTRFNGGVSWSTPFRPPLTVCAAIAQRVWQVALDRALAVYGSLGLAGPALISLEETNEPGVGGAGAAYSGTSTFASVSAAGAQGFIEPEFWAMLWELQSHFDPRGCRLYAVTFEGQQSDNDRDGRVDAQVEIDSVCGVYAQAVLMDPKVRGVGFNRYSVPASSVSACGSSWGYREDWEARHLRANPLLRGKGLFVTEFGVSSRSVAGRVDLYRLAVLRRQRASVGLDGGGMFLSLSTNALNRGFELWGSDLGVVGGFVGPGVR